MLRKSKYFSDFLSLSLSFLFILFLSTIAYSLPNEPIQSKWIPNGNIHTAVEGPDGMTYLGGEFNRIGPYSGSAVPINLTQNAVLPQFPKVNGEVRAIISDGKGGWYLGGLFDRVGEERVRNLVHILPNYSVDLKFQPDPDDAVNTIVLSGDKKTLYIGGYFKTIFDENLKLQQISGLAKFDADSGKLDPNWNLNLRRFSSGNWYPGSIRVIITNGETLYVAGSFDLIFGEKIRGLAKFNKEVLDSTFKPTLIPEGIGSNSFITSLALHHETLYVGGSSLNVGGVKKNLARFSKDILDSTWNPPMPIDAVGIVNDLFVNGENLYVTGRGGSGLDTYLVRLKNGALDPSWESTLKGAFAITSSPTGDILYMANGSSVTKLDKNGTVDSTWKPLDIDSRDRSVNTLAMSEDGNTLYVGGGFHTVEGKPVPGLIRLNKEGEPDFGWKVDAGRSVNALFFFDEDTLYLGSPDKGLSRLQMQEGILDTSWRLISSLSVFPLVSSFALNQGFTYIGGGFGQVIDPSGNSQSIGSLARFDQGTLDTEWKPNPTYNGFIPEYPGIIGSLVTSGNTLYVAGLFDKIFDKNGIPQPVSSLARFDQGMLDTNWRPNLKPIKVAGRDWLQINALAIVNDFLYVAGAFQTEDGKIQNLARFNLSNGMLDSGWHPNPSDQVGSNTPVSVLVANGNTFYVGGYFQAISNAKKGEYRYLVKFDNGVLDLNWHPNRDCYVQSLAIGGDSLYVTGYFRDNSTQVTSNCFFQFQSSLQFVQNEIKKDRKSEVVDLDLVLSEPDPSPVTVDYKITGGTAKKGVDYEFIDGILSFSPRETQKTISLKIKDNPKETNDLTIEISLLNPTGVFLGKNKKLTYTIKKAFTTATPTEASQGDLLQNSGGCSLADSQVHSENFKIGFLLYWIGISFIFLYRTRLKKSEPMKIKKGEFMRRKIVFLGVLLAVLCFSKVETATAAGIYAYITNTTPDTVSIIDTSTNIKLENDIRVGIGPWGVVVTPDGKKVYIVNNGLGGFSTVSVIDALTNTKIGDNIHVQARPEGIAITPDGKKVYVANNGSGSVSVIDTENNKVIKTILLFSADPLGIAITPDGKKAYVTNSRVGTVSIIDTASDAAIGSDISVGPSPRGIAITPDGSKAYVTHDSTDPMSSTLDTVSVIDTSTNKVTTIKLLPNSTPTGIVITPDGKKAYVANEGSNSISMIDIKNNKKIPWNIPVENGPIGIAITPDGGKVYVANYDSGTVSVIDTTNDVKVADINVGIGPIAFGNFITPFAITSPLTATGRVDEPFSYTLTAPSYRPLQSLTVDPLPPGLKFDFNSGLKTGLISGTPTSAGTFRINLGASNDKVSINEILVLTIAPSATPAISSPLTVSGKVGQLFSYTFTATGDQPMTFTASPLPNGLNFDKSTGILSGTPTEAGNFNINLSATNAAGTDTEVLVVAITKADSSQSDGNQNSGGGCSLTQSNSNDFKIASLFFLMSTGLLFFRRARVKH